MSSKHNLRSAIEEAALARMREGMPDEILAHLLPLRISRQAKASPSLQRLDPKQGEIFVCSIMDAHFSFVVVRPNTNYVSQISLGECVIMEEGQHHFDYHRNFHSSGSDGTGVAVCKNCGVRVEINRRYQPLFFARSLQELCPDYSHRESGTGSASCYDVRGRVGTRFVQHSYAEVQERLLEEIRAQIIAESQGSIVLENAPAEEPESESRGVPSDASMFVVEGQRIYVDRDGYVFEEVASVLQVRQWVRASTLTIRMLLEELKISPMLSSNGPCQGYRIQDWDKVRSGVYPT